MRCVLSTLGAVLVGIKLVFLLAVLETIEVSGATFRALQSYKSLDSLLCHYVTSSGINNGGRRWI